MNIYGDMIAFFPEMVATYGSFVMSPDVIAGYGERRNHVRIQGILQHIKPGDLDLKDDVLSDITVPTLWTRTELPKDAYIEEYAGRVSRQGTPVLDDLGEPTGSFLYPDSGTVVIEGLYRRTKKNSWKKYGSFYIYILEELSGVDYRQSSDEEVMSNARSKYL